MDSEEKLSYEEAIARLEEIARKMESGEMTLDQSVKAYEEGSKLIKFCEDELKKYEERIKNTENGQ